jgi:hypothetical protein
MKINFDTELRDLYDKPLPNGGDKPLTLAEVACTALLAAIPDDQMLSMEDKVKMFRLAQLAAKGGEQDIKTEDATLLKNRVGKCYGALIVGRVYDLIEG